MVSRVDGPPQLLWSGVLLGLFCALWVAVAVAPPLVAADLALVGHVHDVTHQPFVDWARELTALGRMNWIFGLTAGGVLVLIALRHRTEALALTLAVASTHLAVAAVKELMLRQRPPADDAVFQAGGHSFPSGHAATSFALFASVAFLLSRGRSTRVRVAMWVAMAPLALGIGLTRVYLGVHYPTDIAAGWLLGGACATAAWVLACHLGRKRPRSATAAPDGTSPRAVTASSTGQSARLTGAP